jgi:hypothetical protein
MMLLVIDIRAFDARLSAFDISSFQAFISFDITPAPDGFQPPPLRRRFVFSRHFAIELAFSPLSPHYAAFITFFIIGFHYAS